MGQEINVSSEDGFVHSERSIPYSDFSSASKAAVHLIKQVTSFQFFSMTRVEHNDMQFIYVEDEEFGIPVGHVIHVDQAICPQVITNMQSCFISDVSKWPKLITPQSSIKVGAYIGLPIMLDEHKLFGTICGINSTPVDEFSDYQIETIQTIVRMLSSVLLLEVRSKDQIRSYERVKMEAERDELTGLLNRRGWDNALLEEEALCSQYGFEASIVVIDIDNLKTVNDSQGHQAGDEVIRRAAAVIESTSRSNDVVARTGGDEFAVLTKGVSEAGTDAFVRRLRIALNHAGVSASVGISSRTDIKSLTDAWNEADRAMYIVKRSKA